MDTIMTKIAYKINTTNPNLPNGFIVDHFETDQDTVEGYIVVDMSVFSQIFANNVTLLRQHETNRGITPSNPFQPPHPKRPNNEAEPIDQTVVAARKQEMADAQAASEDNAKLFKEFLAWKNSGGNAGS